MMERFGKDTVITYVLSNKIKHIKNNPAVAIAGEWFTAHGKGSNLGYFGKIEIKRRNLRRRIRMGDVHKNCPKYENEDYLVRMVCQKDKMDLLKVYSDKRAVPHKRELNEKLCKTNSIVCFG